MRKRAFESLLSADMNPKPSTMNLQPSSGKGVRATVWESAVNRDHDFLKNRHLFRDINVFTTEEVTKELISRNFLFRDRIL